MPKEDMLEQIIKEFKTVPDRKSLKHDGDIFGKHVFSGEEKEHDPGNKTEFDLFKRVSEIILF